MLRYNLKVKIDVNDEDIIIWINHSVDYKYGTYYRIDKDKNVFLCVEKPNEVYEILQKGSKI